MLDALQQYDWPGNIRELEHTVQRMVAMNSGPWLAPADLPSTVMSKNRERDFLSASGQDLAAPSIHCVTPLADVERRAILNALEYTKGDRTVAAAMLGIGRTTLYRKLKEYGL